MKISKIIAVGSVRLVRAYGYDATNELIGINYLSLTNTSMDSLIYGYDMNGRRINKNGSFATDVLPAVTKQNATFDANNRQIGYNGQVLSYAANGNLTSDISIPVSIRRRSLHKNAVGARPNDWTGIDPDGNVVIGDHNGGAVDNGPYGPMVNHN